MPGKQTTPAKHKDKVIRAALKTWTIRGWELREAGHGMRLYCPCGCTTISISNSPQNSDRAARKIHQLARRHPLTDTDPRRAR